MEVPWRTWLEIGIVSLLRGHQHLPGLERSRCLRERFERTCTKRLEGWALVVDHVPLVILLVDIGLGGWLVVIPRLRLALRACARGHRTFEMCSRLVWLAGSRMGNCTSSVELLQ